MSGEREREREEIYCLCDFYGFMIRGRIASVGATTSMNGYLAAIDDTVLAWSLRMWRKKIPWPYDKLEHHVYFMIKVNFVLDKKLFVTVISEIFGYDL